jgi:2-keto-4-pentenoate hydratase/2-oxohepta-3-ene-1,7-dioic acid hydratase in catechol pathway
MSDIQRWVRHETSDGLKWSPVPDNRAEGTVTEAGPQPDDKTMNEFGPVGYNELSVMPPTEPTRVVALAHNYKGLINEKKKDEKEPLLFLKTPSSVIGPGDPIEIPQQGATWAEVELGFVVNKTARDVSASDAADYIRGYTVANDVTTEGVYNRNWHLPRSKARETFCPTGPHLVQGVNTADIKMKTHINGDQTQASTTAKRIYNDAEALEFISSLMTLESGDLILTGTPSGATESIITDGTVVAVEIEDIGQLENPVVLSK